MKKEEQEFIIKLTIIMDCIESGDKVKFMQMIKKLNKTQVYQLIYAKDIIGYNLIHKCAFKNRFEMLKFLIEQFKVSCREILIENNQFHSPNAFVSVDQID